jgi:hypothetical protein
MTFSANFSIQGISRVKAFLYNPSEKTIAAATAPQGGKKQTFIIDAGYEEDHGICITGEIHKAEVKVQGTEKVLEMEIHDSVTDLSNRRVCRSWPRNARASKVVNDLSSLFALKQGKIEVGTDKTYPNGLTLNKKLKDAVKDIARETQSDFFIRDGRFYFISKNNQGLRTGVVLSPAQGLIGSPEVKQTGNRTTLKIKSLFNYKIGAGEHVTLKSDSVKGDFKVLKGSHSYSVENAYTSMEVIRL